MKAEISLLFFIQLCNAHFFCAEDRCLLLFFTWHLEFLPSFRFFIKYKTVRTIMHLLFHQFATQSLLPSLSVRHLAFMLFSLYLLLWLLCFQWYFAFIQKKKWYFAFYFFINLLNKSLGVALDKLSGFLLNNYFPIWKLKSHFYFPFNLQCIFLLCRGQMATAILYGMFGSLEREDSRESREDESREEWLSSTLFGFFKISKGEWFN